MQRMSEMLSGGRKTGVRPSSLGLVLMFVLALVPASLAQQGLTLDHELDAGSTHMGPDGRWKRARPTVGHTSMTAAQKAEADRLRSIGYLSGSKPAPSTSGVTIHDRDLAQPGLNLFSSGHHPGAVLMTMDGEIVHEWECPFLRAFPDSFAASENDGAEYWRFVHLFDNGDVLAIFEGLGLVKLDRDSNILWTSARGEHHALHVEEDGRIYVLTRKAHILPRLQSNSPVLEDYLTVLDENGEELHSFSLLKAFEESRFENALRVFGMHRRGDLFHTNAVEVLDGSQADRLPAFKKGNVLISLRQLNILAVIDLEYEEAVWVGAGMWLAQHDPKFLANGNILLFDNKGYGGKSKVLEFDPVTYDVAWSYWGTVDVPFYSQMCGAAQRLENGNTLITESDYGRAFEVSPEGDIVWEFVNPERAGKSGELIATLFELERVDPRRFEAWFTD